MRRSQVSHIQVQYTTTVLYSVLVFTSELVIPLQNQSPTAYNPTCCVDIRVCIHLTMVKEQLLVGVLLSVLFLTHFVEVLSLTMFCHCLM